MTGLEVMRRYLQGPLLASPGGVSSRVSRPRLPAIFMSGEATPEIRAEVDELGLLLVDKPFHPDLMRAEVRRALHDLI
jgi:CheY-like chemotaxis protein